MKYYRCQGKCGRIISEKEYEDEQGGGSGGYCYCEYSAMDDNGEVWYPRILIEMKETGLTFKERAKMDSENIDKNWKPLSLPQNDCMYLGVLEEENRLICDAAGDDISPEFCHYCRYASKTYGVKPHEFAERFFSWMLGIAEEKTAGSE